jgi:hypothetical protein
VCLCVCVVCLVCGVCVVCLVCGVCVWCGVFVRGVCVWCVCVCVARRTAMDFYVENCSKCRIHLPITSGKINFTLGSSLQES